MAEQRNRTLFHGTTGGRWTCAVGWSREMRFSSLLSAAALSGSGVRGGRAHPAPVPASAAARRSQARAESEDRRVKRSADIGRPVV